MEIHIEHGQGLDGLKKALQGLLPKKRKQTPLLVVKDHPELQKIFDDGNAELERVLKEVEALQKKVKEEHEKTWTAAQDYLKSKNLWPSDDPKGEVELNYKDGVLFHETSATDDVQQEAKD